MAEPTTDIVVAIAEWIGERAGLPIDPAAGEPRGLWAHAIEEADGGGNVADPASVIRAYPGGSPAAAVPLHHALLQAYTVAAAPADAYARATRLYDALADATGENAGLAAIDQSRNGWTFSVTARRSPGQIGRDAKGRVEVVFNFEAHYTRQ